MTTGKVWRNRKERNDWARRLRSEDPGLEVVHPHAAGIDVGNSAHKVAVRPDRDPEPVRRFECFTADLSRLVDCTVGSVREEISRWCHGGPKRARSWKRRTRPRKIYSLSGLLYSERRRRFDSNLPVAIFRL